jgi:hypothetical protein
MNTLQNIRLQLQTLFNKTLFKENNSPVPNLDLKLSASELASQKHSIVLYKTIKNYLSLFCHR